MIEKTFSGANQYTEPVYVASEQRFQYEIKESTPTFSATVSVQVLMSTTDPTRPHDTDSRWTTVKAISAGSSDVAGVSNIGKGWYRLAILAGDHISGESMAKVSTG